jgi:hypothetical protein
MINMAIRNDKNAVLKFATLQSRNRESSEKQVQDSTGN